MSWQAGEITVLNDAYNANPLSMSAMLARVAGITSPGHKHLVLADMRELGPDSDRYHQALVEPIVDSGAQAVWLLGEQMHTVAEALKPHIERVAHFADISSLETALKAELRAGDWIAFKGSNKFGLSQLAKALAE